MALSDEINNRWKRDRRSLIGEQNIQLIGQQTGSEQMLEDQRFKVALFVREAFDSGFDPVTLVQSLLVGSCWLGDQVGISRQNMAKIIHMAKLPEGSVLSPIIKP